MRRREFLTLLGGAAAAWPLAARGQQGAMPVIGFLNPGSEPAFRPYVRGFLNGLADTGHVEGRDVALEYRWAGGQIARLPELASELVSREIKVLVASGGEPAVLAAKAATVTIPTLFSIGGDPVRQGLVSSFNRPEGNLTGITLLTADLEAKRFELLTDMIPGVTTVAALVNPRNPNVEAQLSELRDASRRLGRQLVTLTAHTPAEIDAALLSLDQRHVGGLIVASDPLFNNRRTQIVELVSQHPLPAIYQWREFVAVGGLASYGTNLAGMYRILGRYAGRIVKGERPSDLPVVQPTQFELVINLKTAKALGLELPPTLLARADEVIE